MADAGFMDRCAGADPEHPVFADMDIYESGDTEPYVRVKAAVTAEYGDGEDRFLRIAVLEAENGEGMSPRYSLPMRFGSVRVVNGNNIGEAGFLPAAEWAGRYEDFEECHEGAAYSVRCALFSETPEYSPHDSGKEFPKYRMLEGSERTFDLTDAVLLNGDCVDSAGRAFEWMIENHPDYVQGMEISQACASGEFFASQVPGPVYGEGYYENFEARHGYAEKMARETFQTEAGPAEAWDVVRMLRQMPYPEGFSAGKERSAEEEKQ